MKVNNTSIRPQIFRRQIKKEVRADYQALYTLLFLTGMRVSEALPLTWYDFTPTKDGFVVVRAKTLKRKDHPLKDVFINLKGRNKKLWFDYLAPFLSVNSNNSERLFNISRWMAYKGARALGFKTIHNLRRSYINNMAECGATEQDVVNMLNLSSSIPLKEYQQQFNSEVRKARLKTLRF